jgi:hypothetical protein
MKRDDNRLIPFSETHARAMLNPEFRKAYEAPDEEDLAMRAFMDARIKAKKLEENTEITASVQRFAS